MKEETKGLYLAIVLSTIAVLIVNWIWPSTPQTPDQKSVSVVEQPIQEKEQVSDTVKTSTKTRVIPVEEALKKDERIEIDNDKLSGSIRIKGARFDNLNLTKYKQTLEQDSLDVRLLTPAETETPYYAEFGWLSNDSSIKLPNHNTIWKVIGSKLTPEAPITLEWNNGQGIKFIHKIIPFFLK